MNKFSEFWDYVRDKMNTDDLSAHKVFKYINKDKLSGIYIDSETNKYHLETTNSGEKIPFHVQVFIKRWMKKQGYKFLWD